MKESTIQHVESQCQKIYTTKDYALFTHSSRNRECDLNLVESIKRKNMLPSHPILVDKNLMIIDGQHRLAAAELLGLTIYYIIDNEADETYIPICQIQKAWCLSDFAHFYSDSNSDYKYVYDTYKAYSLSTAFVMNACAKKYSNFRRFREGRYKIEYPYPYLDIKFNELKDLMDIIKPIISRTILQNALRALWKIITQSDYNHTHFLEKIDQYPSPVISSLKFQQGTEIYTSLINTVYNRNSKSDKKKMFVEERKVKLRRINNNKHYNQYNFTDIL